MRENLQETREFFGACKERMEGNPCASACPRRGWGLREVTMHRLLDKQVKEATRDDGELDLARLLGFIDGTYGKTDEERRGIVRSMQLMSDEATALTRELRASTASHLQAVLDHVKDVIMTVDEQGHIATVNATGQRVFGHSEAEVIGRPLSFLLPQLGSKITLAEELEQLAARLDDTQTDLAPHET